MILREWSQTDYIGIETDLGDQAWEAALLTPGISVRPNLVTRFLTHVVAKFTKYFEDLRGYGDTFYIAIYRPASTLHERSLPHEPSIQIQVVCPRHDAS